MYLFLFLPEAILVRLMKGVYRIKEDRITSMKGGSRAIAAKSFLIIYLVLAVLLFFGSSENKMEEFFYLTIFFVLVFSFFMFVTLLIKSEVYNSVIEITDSGVIRTGDNLMTIKLQFTEIGSIIRKDNGTILLRKGIMSSINLYTNKRAYLNEKGILFIPLALDNYEKVIEFIKSETTQRVRV